MWDRFFRQRAYIGITRSRMRWYVRKKYLTWVKTAEILIWCARIFNLTKCVIASTRIIYLNGLTSWCKLACLINSHGTFTLRVCCTSKLVYYFQSGTCLGSFETHVLPSFLWPVFCKRPVISVTLLTLK